MTPVILDFDRKLGIERTMCIRCQRHIVGRIQTGWLIERLRSIFFTFISKFLWSLTQINFVNGSNRFFPQHDVILIWLQFTQFAFGYSCDHCICKGGKFGMVAQRIAIHHTRTHFFFRNQAKSLHSINHVIERTALWKRNVPVSTHSCIRTIQISIVNRKHFG